MIRPVRRQRHWAGWAAGLVVVLAMGLVTWIIVQQGRGPTQPVLASSGGEVLLQQVPAPGRTAAQPGSLGVTGVVLLPDGAPAPGARVRLYRAKSAWPEWQRDEIESTGTSTDGEFRFRTQRGPGLLVEFQHDDYAGELIEAPSLVPRLQLRLQPGFVVSGRVEGEAGQKVLGCRVVLEATLGEPRRAMVVIQNQDGTFLFKNVPAGSVRVVARHPQWQPAVLPMVTVGASSGLVLRLKSGPLLLQGKVVTLSQPPRAIQGARVRALPNVNNRALFEPVDQYTDSNGEFRLPELGQGNVRLEVRHQDWSTMSRPVAVSASSPHVVFEVVPRAEVRGRLHDLEQANGGVAVELALRTAAGEIARCRAETDGTFAFPGTFSLGNATLEATGGAIAFARSAGAELPIQIEEGKSALDLDVVQPSVVTGRVVDADGRPLPGASLLDSPEVLRAAAPERVLAVTDAAGRFRIQGLAARNISLRVTASDCASQRVDVTVGAAVQVPDIVLAAGGRIRGRVFRGERPLAGALVQAVGPGGGATVSRDDGTFLLTDLSPGNYRVRARYSTLPLAFGSGTIVVTAGVTAGPDELAFPPGRTVTGVVLGRDEQPVEGAVVSVKGLAGSAPIVTNENGAFSIEVPPSSAVLQVDSGDVSARTTESIDATVKEVAVYLDVPQTATITARVLSLPGRKPVPSVLLRIITDDAGATVRSRWLETVAGSLRYRFLPAQRCLVVFQCEGFAPNVQWLNIPATDSRDLGEILLEPGAALRGRVLDEAGSPVPGCIVGLGTEADLRDFTPGGRTLPDGTFVLQGVSSATPTLVAMAQGYAVSTIRLRLPQDVLRKEPLPVTLLRGERLEVTVPRVSGTEGQVVVLERGGVTIATAEVGEDGTAVFTHRSAGEYVAHLLEQDEPRVTVVLDGKSSVQRVELR